MTGPEDGSLLEEAVVSFDSGTVAYSLAVSGWLEVGGGGIASSVADGRGGGGLDGGGGMLS